MSSKASYSAAEGASWLSGGKSDGKGHLVLHVRVVTGSGGGPDKTILASAAHLMGTTYRQAAAFMHPPNDPGFSVLERRASFLGCPLVEVPDRGSIDPAVPRRLLALCRKLDVRIWHGHDYKSNAIGLLLRTLHPMKLVTTVHGWVKRTARTPLYYAVDRFCLRYYDHVIAVSADLEQRAHRVGVRPERCSLIPNAVEEGVFERRVSSAEASLRAEGQVPEGRLVVGAIGRLSSEKGFHHLLQATRALLTDGVDLELWIAGEGENLASLRQLIQSLALEGRVKLFGFVDDVVELFHAMDVFVLSSVREGLPNVLLEAMSMRVPAVATRVAGVPTLIRDGENGLLCRPDDATDLATALARLLTDPALRERFAYAGRRTIEERFRFVERVAAERAIYDRLLAVPATRPRRFVV